MVGSSSSSVRAARESLAARLRDLRADAGLTVRGLATQCGWSHSKVSRIENARTAPSASDLHAWAHACDAADQADDLAAALRTVEGMWIDWRRLEHAGLAPAQRHVRPDYEQTRAFHSYNSWLIPGLFQTADYASVVLHATRRRRQLIQDVDAAVTERIDRQHVLTQSGRSFAFVIEESVLRTGIGGPMVMREQLHRLLEVGFLPAVSLGIIAMQPAREAMRPVEGFWMFDARKVVVELVSGYLTITNPREIKMYADVFAKLSALAVYGDNARGLIKAAIDTL